MMHYSALAAIGDGDPTTTGYLLGRSNAPASERILALFTMTYALTALELKPIMKAVLIALLRAAADAIEGGNLLETDSIVDQGELAVDPSILEQAADLLSPDDETYNLTNADVGAALGVELEKLYVVANNQKVLSQLRRNAKSKGVTVPEPQTPGDYLDDLVD